VQLQNLQFRSEHSWFARQGDTAHGVPRGEQKSDWLPVPMAMVTLKVAKLFNGGYQRHTSKSKGRAA
jgi:hypothetical protein